MHTTVATKIHDFFSTYPERSYPRGQILVFADENPEHIFYMVSGKIREYDVSYRGDEVALSIFKPPAFFPMSWAINRTPNKYFYKTEEPTVAHIVPADDALAFIKENPDVMLDLLSRLYIGLDGLLGRVVQLMSGTARSRVVYDLVIECRRFGQPVDGGNYTLTATEVDIAARSGLSRETVSREIQKLKSKGLVDLVGRSIVVNDLSGLEKILGVAV